MGRGTSFDLRETILLLLFVLFDTTKAAQLGCYASFLLEKKQNSRTDFPAARERV